MMQRNCDIPKCPNYGRYCRIHYPGLKQEGPKPLAKVSEKRAIVNRKEYHPVVKELKKETNTCQINSPVCIKKPVHAHHVRGRIGKQLTKKKDMIMACDPCNAWVEAHPKLAEALGFKKSKHEPNYQRVK